LQQLVAVEKHRIFQEVAQTLVLFILGFALGRLCLEFNPGFFRQIPQRLREIPALFFHHKPEYVATLIALTETAPGARIGEDHESRGARVGVEWAKTGIAFTGAAQLYRLRYQIDDINSGFYLVRY
jgi:hypothetical protein